MFSRLQRRRSNLQELGRLSKSCPAVDSPKCDDDLDPDSDSHSQRTGASGSSSSLSASSEDASPPVTRAEKQLARQSLRRSKQREVEFKRKMEENRISMDDFLGKQAEFRLWLLEEQKKQAKDLSSPKRKTYFKMFVRLWNKRHLPSKYYDPRQSHHPAGDKVKVSGVMGRPAFSLMHNSPLLDPSIFPHCVDLSSDSLQTGSPSATPTHCASPFSTFGKAAPTSTATPVRFSDLRAGMEEEKRDAQDAMSQQGVFRFGKGGDKENTSHFSYPLTSMTGGCLRTATISPRKKMMSASQDRSLDRMVIQWSPRGQPKINPVKVPRCPSPFYRAVMETEADCKETVRSPNVHTSMPTAHSSPMMPHSPDLYQQVHDVIVTHSLIYAALPFPDDEGGVSSGRHGEGPQSMVVNPVPKPPRRRSRSVDETAVYATPSKRTESRGGEGSRTAWQKDPSLSPPPVPPKTFSRQEEGLVPMGENSGVRAESSAGQRGAPPLSAAEDEASKKQGKKSKGRLPWFGRKLTSRRRSRSCETLSPLAQKTAAKQDGEKQEKGGGSFPLLELERSPTFSRRVLARPTKLPDKRDNPAPTPTPAPTPAPAPAPTPAPAPFKVDFKLEAYASSPMRLGSAAPSGQHQQSPVSNFQRVRSIRRRRSRSLEDISSPFPRSSPRPCHANVKAQTTCDQGQGQLKVASAQGQGHVYPLDVESRDGCQEYDQMKSDVRSELSNLVLKIQQLSEPPAEEWSKPAEPMEVEELQSSPKQFGRKTQRQAPPNSSAKPLCADASKGPVSYDGACMSPPVAQSSTGRDHSDRNNAGDSSSQSRADWVNVKHDSSRGATVHTDLVQAQSLMETDPLSVRHTAVTEGSLKNQSFSKPAMTASPDVNFSSWMSKAADAFQRAQNSARKGTDEQEDAGVSGRCEVESYSPMEPASLLVAGGEPLPKTDLQRSTCTDAAPPPAASERPVVPQPVLEVACYQDCVRRPAATQHVAFSVSVPAFDPFTAGACKPLQGACAPGGSSSGMRFTVGKRPQRRRSRSVDGTFGFQTFGSFRRKDDHLHPASVEFPTTSTQEPLKQGVMTSMEFMPSVPAFADTEKADNSALAGMRTEKVDDSALVGTHIGGLTSAVSSQPGQAGSDSRSGPERCPPLPAKASQSSQEDSLQEVHTKKPLSPTEELQSLGTKPLQAADPRVLVRPDSGQAADPRVLVKPDSGQAADPHVSVKPDSGQAADPCVSVRPDSGQGAGSRTSLEGPDSLASPQTADPGISHEAPPARGESQRHPAEQRPVKSALKDALLRFGGSLRSGGGRSRRRSRSVGDVTALQNEEGGHSDGHHGDTGTFSSIRAFWNRQRGKDKEGGATLQRKPSTMRRLQQRLYGEASSPTSDANSTNNSVCDAQCGQPAPASPHVGAMPADSAQGQAYQPQSGSAPGASMEKGQAALLSPGVDPSLPIQKSPFVTVRRRSSRKRSVVSPHCDNHRMAAGDADNTPSDSAHGSGTSSTPNAPSRNAPSECTPGAPIRDGPSENAPSAPIHNTPSKSTPSAPIHNTPSENAPSARNAPSTPSAPIRNTPSDSTPDPSTHSAPTRNAPIKSTPSYDAHISYVHANGTLSDKAACHDAPGITSGFSTLNNHNTPNNTSSRSTPCHDILNINTPQDSRGDSFVDEMSVVTPDVTRDAPTPGGEASAVGTPVPEIAAEEEKERSAPQGPGAEAAPAQAYSVRVEPGKEASAVTAPAQQASPASGGRREKPRVPPKPLPKPPRHLLSTLGHCLAARPNAGDNSPAYAAPGQAQGKSRKRRSSEGSHPPAVEKLRAFNQGSAGRGPVTRSVSRGKLKLFEDAVVSGTVLKDLDGRQGRTTRPVKRRSDEIADSDDDCLPPRKLISDGRETNVSTTNMTAVTPEAVRKRSVREARRHCPVVRRMSSGRESQKNSSIVRKLSSRREAGMQSPLVRDHNTVNSEATVVISVTGKEASRNLPAVSQNNSRNSPAVSRNNSQNSPAVSRSNSRNSPAVSRNNSQNSPAVSRSNSRNSPAVSRNNSRNSPAVSRNNSRGDADVSGVSRTNSRKESLKESSSARRQSGRRGTASGPREAGGRRSVGRDGSPASGIPRRCSGGKAVGKMDSAARSGGVADRERRTSPAKVRRRSSRGEPARRALHPDSSAGTPDTTPVKRFSSTREVARTTSASVTAKRFNSLRDAAGSSGAKRASGEGCRGTPVAKRVSRSGSGVRRTDSAASRDGDSRTGSFRRKGLKAPQSPTFMRITRRLGVCDEDLSDDSCDDDDDDVHEAGSTPAPHPYTPTPGAASNSCEVGSNTPLSSVIAQALELTFTPVTMTSNFTPGPVTPTFTPGPVTPTSSVQALRDTSDVAMETDIDDCSGDTDPSLETGRTPQACPLSTLV